MKYKIHRDGKKVWAYVGKRKFEAEPWDVVRTFYSGYGRRYGGWQSMEYQDEERALEAKIHTYLTTRKARIKILSYLALVIGIVTSVTLSLIYLIVAFFVIGLVLPSILDFILGE